MRVSWFSRLRAEQQRRRNRQQLKSAPLRVRQLERRRVLDAAATSVVVSTVVMADGGETAPVATTTHATDAPPIAVPLIAAGSNSSDLSAEESQLSPGQGLASNVPPTLIVATNQQVDEGQLLNLSATGGAPPLGLFVDPDLGDTHTATIDWGDGSPIQNATIIGGSGAGVIGGAHIYADDGNYTVTVNVADDNGGSASQSFDVLVKNVRPVLVTATDQTLNEGQLLDLSATGGAPPLGLFVDPGIHDTHTATVNWGDGSGTQSATVIEATGAGVIGGSHTYSDNGLYTVIVTVTDNGGASSSGTFQVTVNNVAPSVELTGPTSVDEGSLNSWTIGPVIDPGADTVSQYILHWGDGTTDTYTAAEIAGMSNMVGHTYADGPNNYTIAVDLVDEDGTHPAVDTLAVTVNNVPPTLELTGPTSVYEGSNNNWTLGPVVDPGTDTVTQYIIHWGDGNTDTYTAAEIAGMSNMVGHTYADGPNIYTIAVDLVDEDGTHPAVDTLAVTVNNVPPKVELTGPTQVDEGAPNTWLIGPVVDPGGDTVSQYVIHWGDGKSDTFTAVEMAGMGNTIGHTYLEGPNSYQISVDLVDDDGTHLDVDSLKVEVNNVAPSVSLNAVPDIEENGSATLTGSYTDPGVEDFHVVKVSWADPNSSGISTFVVPAIQDTNGMPTLGVGVTIASSTDSAVLIITAVDATTGQVSFSVQHQYRDDGLAPGNGTASDLSPIAVIVTDDDGASGNGATTVTVYNEQPSVSLNAVLDILENGFATVSGTYTDKGLLDSHVATVIWGDANNGLASTFVVPAIQDANGVPTLGVGVTIASSTDSAVLTITAIDAATGQVSFSVQHQYLDDGLAPGNGTASDTTSIHVTVVDDDGGSGSNKAAITIHDVAPTVSLNSVLDINENGVASLTGTYTDIGLLDAHTLTINWGDPNNSAASTFAINALRNAAGTATLNIGDTFNSSTDSAVLTITSINAATGQVSFSVQHQYLDDGLAPGNNTISDVSTIGVAVADDDTLSGSSATTLTIHNVTPSVVLNSVSDISENGVATLTGSYTDIGSLDTHTLTVGWGDPNNSAASTFAINALRNAAGAATLNIGDTFNSSTDSAVLTITSINAATGQVSFSVQHQYLDDGLAPGNNTISDVSTIGVTIADDDTQSSSSNASVTVHNVAPTVALNSVPDINENGIATLTGSFTDIGRLDAHAVTVDWNDPNTNLDSTFAVSAIRNAAGMATLSVGDTFASSTDGAVLTITAINAATGQVSFSVQHQYLDDGLAPGNNTISDVSTIGVTVADDDTQAGSHTTTVTVHNITAVVALNAVPDINENGVATLTGSYTDIGLLDGHVLSVNWGDANNGVASTFTVNAIRDAAGTATLLVGDAFNSATDGAVLTITAINAATGQVSFSVQHQYLDDGLAPGNNTISDVSTIGVTVADDDAQSGSSTTTVTVHNVAPIIVNLTGDSLNEGQVATMSLQVGDPGTLDVFTFNVDWRDSGPVTIASLGAIDSSGVSGTTKYTWIASTRQLTLTHLYPDNADYLVVVKLADDDMAGNFAGVASAANYVQQSVLVSVANVSPDLAGTSNLAVDEGSAVTLAGLGVHIVDPGFDNPSNQTPTIPGNLTNEDFVAYSINWGDNSPTVTTMPVNVVNRISGSLNGDLISSTLTTADFLHAAHYFADDGVYTVTVRMADDNMGAYSDPSLFETGVAGVDYIDRTFEITVKNVTPTLVVNSATSQQQTGAGSVTTTPVTPATTIEIKESGTVSLAASFSDPGFSLDANPSAPSGSSFPRNEIFRYYISWGDNRETIGELTAADVASLVNGGPNNLLTTGAFDTNGMIHTYADDGTYTVTVRLADDNMGAFADTSKFASGVGVDFGTNNGGDFVETTFTVVVKNIAPIFVPQPGGQNVVGTDVSSAGITTINAAFSDLGFDNTANLNSPAPPTITDTKHETFTHVLNWGDGTVDALHTYPSSETHNVAITQTGPGGTQTFTVAGIDGLNTVLTLVSGQDINNPNAIAQLYTYVIDWGDGNVQTISLMLKSPGNPTVNGLTTVGSSIRTTGNVGVPTTGSMGISHRYLGPPDPINPSADIVISVMIVDDNNASVSDSVKISNPGIQEINIAIDTTPDVPRLALPSQQTPPVLLGQTSAAPSNLQPIVARVALNEMMAASDRYFELVVVSPDGIELERYRLDDAALLDLRGLFSTLPDNRYRIYLYRGDNNSHRLVMDVFVRRGRVIDRSDKTEGTRDRPPTSDVAPQNDIPHNQSKEQKPKQDEGPSKQVVPLKNNPLLNRLPNEKQGSMNLPVRPAISSIDSAAEQTGETPRERSPSSWRWAASLAGVGLAMGRESWAERLGTAFEKADDQAWQRLRQAGRLGKSRGKSSTGGENLAESTNYRS